MTARESLREAAKDGCNYCLDLSKQFIAFAAGGLAFVVGLATADASRPSLWLTTPALICFAISMLAGLTFHMKLIGNVSGERNYDAFDPGLTRIAQFQMLLFASGVLILGVITVMNSFRGRSAKLHKQSVEIQTHQGTINIPLTDPVTIHMEITGNREAIISVKGVIRTNSP
jgi:hypothetical protein